MAASMPTIKPMAPVTPPPETESFRIPPLSAQSQLKRKASEDLAAASGQVRHPHPQPAPSPLSQLGLDGQQNLTQATVARIAAYYHQRSQAIVAAQQQKCQAWANTHRQKALFMMRASMLVVAWHVQDRIRRRQRRQNKKFRSALRAQYSKPGISSCERVRRWAKKVPDAMVSAEIPALDDLADPEEAAFTMDQERPRDKDAKLLEMADSMIRSQDKRVEVPIFGVLSFEESGESESESEDEEEEIVQESEGEEEEDDEDEDDEDDEEDYDDDDDEGNDVKDEYS